MYRRILFFMNVGLGPNLIFYFRLFCFTDISDILNSEEKNILSEKILHKLFYETHVLCVSGSLIIELKIPRC